MLSVARGCRATPGPLAGIGSVGIFLEDRERPAVNIFQQVQKKKLLTTVEKAGLLSAAEKAGLSLGKIEKLGLLSTAERLGLLSLAEDLLTTDPGKISSGEPPGRGPDR